MNKGTTIYDYGPVPDTAGFPGVPARIIAQHKERYEVVCAEGFAYARLKAGSYYAGDELFPTVGDYVMVNHIENGDSQILKTLHRRSFFSRLAPGTTVKEQAIAANFDYVFILQSMNQNFNLRRLERYLALAWQSGAIPVIVLTKADMTENPGSYITQAMDVSPGVEIHAVSAKTGEGLDALDDYLKPGKTLVFLGSSGVGKSSLVNALAGEDIMETGGIRETDSKGRHTTTHRQLVRIPKGALIIDTPGMRELGMVEASDGLENTFEDVEKYIGKCRFSDCRHENEPGCAIREAIASGKLELSRWNSYQKLKFESEDSEDRMRRKREWSKAIARTNKMRKRK